MTPALCVINCSALLIVITRGREINCKLTRKFRSCRHPVEDQFRMNKCCRSAAFDNGPTRFAEQRDHSREIFKGGGANYSAITGAEHGALTSRLAAILVAIHGAMSKPGTCSYCGFCRGPEPLIYKTRPPPSLGSNSSSSLRSEGAHIHSFPFTVFIFSIAHRRSQHDDGSPLLPTAL